jgi:CRP/FNR family transcriptional regulator, nitrogen oxide reductase regulator
VSSVSSSQIPKQYRSVRYGTVPASRFHHRSDTIASLTRHFESRFLHGLSQTDFESLLAQATRWTFPGNAVVVNQGDPADRLFLLLKGSGKYFIYTHEGRRLLLLWLTAGEIFGASALLEKPGQYLCGVEVSRGSQVLVWERTKIRDFAARCPRLLENALSIASDYLVWYLATHIALTCHTARQRLAQVLINLANGIGRRVPRGIMLCITNEELANASNVTLFTASRLMAEWQRQGAIVKSRGRVLLCHPQRLFAPADQATESQFQRGSAREYFNSLSGVR